MTQSIRIRILNREYALFVQEEDEALTREVAAYVNDKMVAFKNAHPEQTDLTTAVITSLAFAEEIHTMLENQDQLLSALDDTYDALSEKLGNALDMDSIVEIEDEEEPEDNKSLE